MPARIGRSLLARAAILTLPGLLMSGCAHSILYDESRDKQVQEAVKAVESVRLRGAVESLEKAFADIAAREEASAAELQADHFNETINNISAARSLEADIAKNADEVSNGLIAEVESRLQQLGANPLAYQQMEDSADSLDAAQTTLTVMFIEMHGVAGRRFANCQEIYAAAKTPEPISKEPSARFLETVRVAQRRRATEVFGDMVAKCQQIDGLNRTLSAAFPGGDIEKYAQEVLKIEAQLASHELAKRKAKDQLDKEIAAFSGSGLRPTGEMDQPALEQLKNRAKSLAASIETVSVAQSDLLPQRQVIAEETLQRLESVLAAIAGTSSGDKTDLTPEDQKAVAIVMALPALSDEAGKLFEEANRPRLVPFLAAIDRQKLLVESFEARERIKEKQADAARQRLVAAMNEGRALVSTHNLLTLKDKENNNDKWASQPIMALEKTLSADDKLILYRALGTYADDVRRFRIDSAVWKIRLLAANHEEALVQSKYAAAQWDGLLNTMAKVLADYHAAGLKKSEIAEFTKALGLVGIGIGVAQ